MVNLNSPQTVRTRIAPSPTGYPHIGTLYQALFDYSFAKKNNGHFFIRIEDTDRERFVEDAEEKIYEALDWFSLSEDESPRKGGPYSPYRQSERLDIYQKYALELIEKGGAYYCFCTKDRLDQMRAFQQKEKKPMMYDKHCRSLSKEEIDEKLASHTPYVIRLRIPDGKDFVVCDQIRGEIHFDLSLIEDSVLLKSDGFATYHLAAMVDDHLMHTTHILRGEEWLSSLPKHVLIFDYLKWEKPLFFHTPVLRNPDKSKLSKRHGHTNISWYKEEGYLPEAILNFLALLGWSHPQGKEIFSLGEFIQLFDLKDLKPVAPIFDLKKMDWMNGVYIRSLTNEQLEERLYFFDPSIKELLTPFTDEKKHLLLSLSKERMKTLKEFKQLVVNDGPQRPYSDTEKHAAPVLLSYLQSFSDSEWGDKEIFLKKLKMFQEEKEISMKTIYFLLTGKDKGLPLLEFIEIYGKEAIFKNIK